MPFADDNPFSTRYVRPGEIDYIFSPGENAKSLVQRLASNGWWGEIVGPHGSGKSTLIEALRPHLIEAGRDLRSFTVTEASPTLPLTIHEVSAWQSHSLIIVDGYERLSWWRKWRLKRLCRIRHAGLLITAHKPMGLPSLYETRIVPSIAKQIIQQLLGTNSGLLPNAEIEECLAKSPDNLREALFMLYDRYEQRRRQTFR